MARKVRSTLIQMTCTDYKDDNKNKDAIVKRAIEHIKKAADAGSQIVCLQEVFFGIFFPQYLDAKYYRLAESIPGPTVDKLQKVAKTKKIVIVAPIYEEAMPGVYYNTAVVIDADGSIKGMYRKNHIPHLPFFQEKFYWKPGNLGFPVFRTAYANIGVLICYDRHFPEGARILGLNGAEIVYVPTATTRFSQYLWETELKAHAIANGYFVGGLNRVGVEDKMDFFGSSFFTDPKGNIVGKQGSDRDEAVVTADLDLDAIRETRDLWQFYRDRRPECYGNITELLP